MPRISTISYTKRKRWGAEEARAALDAQARSGLTLCAFAQREGIDPQRLRRWARQLEGTTLPPMPPKATFVEVAQPTAGRVDVVLRCGVVLRVSEAIEPMALRRLVDALDEGAC